MPIKLSTLLEDISPDVERRVRDVLRTKRQPLAQAIRAECRLALTAGDSGDDTRATTLVPGQVAPAYPARLGDIEFPDNFELGLLLVSNRTAIEKARSGVERLLTLRKEMTAKPRWQKQVMASDAELHATFMWADTLLKILADRDPISSLLQYEDDILGVYQYNNTATMAMFDDASATNTASIVLHWGVIGLVAKWMDCGVEDLAAVVLTHELAHAYTQLGADMNKQRWSASLFSQTDIAIKEGLAQYYTDRALVRLGRPYAAAYDIFQRLQQFQTPPYRAHLPWLEKYSPEAMRRAILEARRNKTLTLVEFEKNLESAQQALGPRNEQEQGEA